MYSVQLRERRAENAGLQREITSLSERELPRLVSESSEAQSTHILCGDYDLKIARQNYFTSNQEKVQLVLVHIYKDRISLNVTLTCW